ncbi:MAG: biopolymer transporter ExbD [Bacteroidales bacterium]|nr:biopolymer transporter ExbD [Bacteroidales bacterium]
MINLQNQIKIENSSSSMSDLVFLLLIFFMITSTLISPNAIPLLLPESSSETRVKQDVTVYIDDAFNFYIGTEPVTVANLKDGLAAQLAANAEDGVVLRADKTVPVEHVVTVIDAVNAVNNATGANHKVILATSPKQQ